MSFTKEEKEEIFRIAEGVAANVEKLAKSSSITRGASILEPIRAAINAPPAEVLDRGTEIHRLQVARDELRNEVGELKFELKATKEKAAEFQAEIARLRNDMLSKNKTYVRAFEAAEQFRGELAEVKEERDRAKTALLSMVERKNAEIEKLRSAEGAATGNGRHWEKCAEELRKGRDAAVDAGLKAKASCDTILAAAKDLTAKLGGWPESLAGSDMRESYITLNDAISAAENVDQNTNKRKLKKGDYNPKAYFNDDRELEWGKDLSAEIVQALEAGEVFTLLGKTGYRFSKVMMDSYGTIREHVFSEGGGEGVDRDLSPGIVPRGTRAEPHDHEDKTKGEAAV